MNTKSLIQGGIVTILLIALTYLVFAVTQGVNPQVWREGYQDSFSFIGCMVAIFGTIITIVKAEQDNQN